MDRAPVDLVVDVGNTRLKAAVFGQGRVLAQEAMPHAAFKDITALLAGRTPRAVAVASTAHVHPELRHFLEKLGPLVKVTGDTSAPVTNGYATPATLGADRLANACGAWTLFPGRPALVIDAGTCITYDLVDGQGVFRGGAIAPGLHMRAKAMHAYSARLPEVDPGEQPPLIGTNTLECLASGVHHGMVMEGQGYVSTLRQQYPGLAVVLTGGDGPRFARALKNGIFAHPSLTLVGLYAILQFHFPPTDPVATGRAAGPSGTERR